jgi:hypothetical protein
MEELKKTIIILLQINRDERKKLSNDEYVFSFYLKGRIIAYENVLRLINEIQQRS